MVAKLLPLLPLLLQKRVPAVLEELRLKIQLFFSTEREKLLLLEASTFRFVCAYGSQPWFSGAKSARHQDRRSSFPENRNISRGHRQI